MGMKKEIKQQILEVFKKNNFNEPDKIMQELANTLLLIVNATDIYYGKDEDMRKQILEVMDLIKNQVKTIFKNNDNE